MSNTAEPHGKKKSHGKPQDFYQKGGAKFNKIF